MSTTEKGALPAPDAGRSAHLGDFTLTRRVLVITAWALPVGGASALAALALLRLIGLITNLVFYQRVDTALVAPGSHQHSPFLVLLAPVVGGLVVGLMARFGSEKIRGHGMPEAIERFSPAAVASSRAWRSSSPFPRPSASAPVGRSAPKDPSS